jgi:ferredoxin-NADP reductase
VKYKGTKMYVCGSPEFEEEVCEALFDLGIPKKYLVIV